MLDIVKMECYSIRGTNRVIESGVKKLPRKAHEILVCEKCQTKQAVPATAYKSTTCMDCGQQYAIVAAVEEDGTKSKAFVPYFNQEVRG